jgi:hypothetical protein
MECWDCRQVTKQIRMQKAAAATRRRNCLEMCLMGLRKGTRNLSKRAVPKIQSGHVPCSNQETSGLARARGDGRCDNGTASSRVQMLALFADCDFQQN